jgi:hypothetical protein
MREGAQGIDSRCQEQTMTAHDELVSAAKTGDSCDIGERPCKRSDSRFTAS